MWNRISWETATCNRRAALVRQLILTALLQFVRGSEIRRPGLKLRYASSFNPLTTIGSYTTHENSPGNSPDFVTPASRFGWPARSRHAVACMPRFSHILRASCVAGSLDYARVESGRSSGDEEIWGFTDQFQQFWNSCGRKRVIQCLVSHAE